MNAQPTSSEDLIDTIKPLLEAMPQPSPVYQLAAFFHAAATAAGLNPESISQAAAIFLTTLHGAYVEVRVHRQDGSVTSFVERDFHYDIRPGSPYYTGE